ncbi:MAG TPA: MupA/Atu3671 family FMN-dependent luciferase-like monooxygenase [Polyangia bacterium]|nr:MupA/Atu3671 family FMN-dependent luciferase-like monooxygenase [Polyangia bacterium]
MGSVKSNLGHLDTAAGMAGLIKAALALHHRTIPPSLHFERPNPEIDFASSPFFVNTRLRPWERGAVPRRAGVSSFGIGGTNVHAVLEEAPVARGETSGRPWQIVTLAARSEAALGAMARELAAHLGEHPALELADVAFSRNVGRKAFEHRRALVASNREALVRFLGESRAGVRASPEPARVAFLFPGQGAQEVGMARALYEAEPVFREHFDACAERVRAVAGFDLAALVYPITPAAAAGPATPAAAAGPITPAAAAGAMTPPAAAGSATDAGAGEAAALLGEPSRTLPALLAVEYALAQLWMSWGLRPEALLGHSYGEYTAACLAGVFSLDDLITLAVVRGRLMEEMPPGAMLAVALGEEEVGPLLGEGIELAAVNGRGRCVVAGPVVAIEAIERALGGRGVATVRLATGRAFHTAAVEPLMPRLEAVIAGLRLAPPRGPLVSSLTGTWMTPAEAVDPRYWARQMREPVRFAAGLDTLVAGGHRLLLEVGPGRALTSLAAARLRKEEDGLALASLRRAGRTESELQAMLEALGRLWEAGVAVRWDAFYAHERRRRVRLPSYPFERVSCRLEQRWLVPALPSAAAAAGEGPEGPAALAAGGEAVAAARPREAAERAPGAGAGRVSGVGTIEERLTALWRERLGIEDIGPHDNFLELGGNSLMAVQLVSRMREAFGVQLPVSVLFEEPTVARVAAEIASRTGPEVSRPQDGAARPAAEGLVRVERAGALPLSFVQARLLGLAERDAASPIFNEPLAVSMSGPLDVARLRRSFAEVIRRHETLRTSFEWVQGEVVQRIGAAYEPPLPVVDLRAHGADAPEEARRRARLEPMEPIDLAAGQPLRVRLLRLGEKEHVLLLTIHHVVADTLSLVAFLREAAAIYARLSRGEAPALAPLAFQYVDFAVWQRRTLSGSGGELAAQQAYWREQLAEPPPALDLPVDRVPRPGDGRRPRPARQAFRWPRELREALVGLGQREGTTLFMTLLGGLAALLGRLSGQEDVVIGTSIGNRSRPELEPLIGYVAHSLGLRVGLDGDPSFRELLAEVRGVTLDAYAHPDVPYEQLVGEVEPGRERRAEPLFDALLLLHDQGLSMPFLDMPGLRLGFFDVPDLPPQYGSAMARLAWLMRDSEAGLDGVLEYDAERLAEGTVAHLVAQLEGVLRAAVADPGVRLSRLPLGPVEEEVTLPALPGEERAVRLSQRHLAALDETLSPGSSAGAGPTRGVWLAARERGGELTEIELAWAQSRGLRVVSPPSPIATRLAAIERGAAERRPLEFSLFYFGNEVAAEAAGKYRLLLEGAKFADRHGFAAVWTPERHFHSFGGLYPSPVATSAALAAVTERIHIRAGSVVLPLHDPIRVAEEWSVIDNLSGGRVGLSFAPGWNVRDFVFFPERYAQRREVLLTEIETVRTLWRGGTIERTSGHGTPVAVAIHPRPVQAELPVWLTSTGNPETFRVAGEIGAYVLTNAVGLGQGLAELRDKIALYRQAWRAGGQRPGHGHVTLMLHAFLGAEPEAARRRAREPLLGYFRNSADLFGNLVVSQGLQMDARDLSPADVESLLEAGVRRYLTEGGLFGSPESCAPLVHRLEGMDVDEVACLVDFGLDHETTLAGLEQLALLRERAWQAGAERQAAALAEAGEGLDELLTFCRETGVTHLQCTSALARALLARPAAAQALGTLRVLLVDGEAVPADVAEALARIPGARARASGELAPGRSEAPQKGKRGRRRRTQGAGAAGSGPASQAASRAASQASQAHQASQTSQAGQASPMSQERWPAARAEAIVRVPREGELPLSFAQQRLWYLAQLEPESTAYNVPLALRMTGRLDRAAVQTSLDAVLGRHEVLRTRYRKTETGAAQVIDLVAHVAIEEVDLRGASEEALMALLAERAWRPFDLAEGPLLRVTLVRLGEEEHVLLLAMPHIVTDGWSVAVLLRELTALYAAASAGRPPRLPEPPIQYADYAVWQRRRMQGEALEALLTWWKEALGGTTGVLELPTDRPRSAAGPARGTSRRVHIERPLFEAVKALALREKATPFMVLIAALAEVLRRHAGQDDIVVGTPTAGRNRPETEGLIGCFVNTLALRVDLSGDPSFRELLGRVRRTALAAYAHEELPFERLVEALELPRDLGRPPLVQVMFALQNLPAPSLGLPGLRLEPLALPSQAAKFDLTFDLTETPEGPGGPGGLVGSLEYNAALFDAATVDRLVRHFTKILGAALAAPEEPLSRFDGLDAAERERLVVEWNQTRAPYSEAACLHTLFAAQAERTPEAVALRQDGAVLRYGELERRANQLAWHLHGHGVGPEVVVGVALGRSFDTVVALLGVLKAGGAWLPLEPSHPRERLQLLLEDSGARAVLSQTALRPLLPDIGVPVICLDEAAPSLAAAPVTPPPVPSHPDQLAYVLYTSGSTGRPKGVLAPHRGTINRFEWMWRVHPFAAGEVACHKTALSFVDSVWELLGPLLAGVPAVLIPEDVVKDPPRLVALLAAEGVTRLVLVPSLLQAMLELPDDRLGRLEKLRLWVTSGERLPEALAQRFCERFPHARLLNLYGSSEIAADATADEVRPDTGGLVRVTIGRPISNLRAYVLDARLAPVPVGVPGELYVGGVGLARGYLGQPGLTAERFVPDPLGDAPGGRLYRTGDVARTLPDGRIEYLGRRDFQIKLRGIRVELGEIEAALAQHPAVREVTLTARDDGPGGRRLVAYVVPAPGEEPAVSLLRAHLRERLPDYMVPSVFVLLDALPRTPGGKVDRRALPAPPRRSDEGEEGFVPPRTESEALVARVWGEVLRLGRVGREDHFFDLGGHSLLATQVMSRLGQASGVELPLRALFEAPTVAMLAARIDQGLRAGRKSAAPPLTPQPRNGPVPLSFAQQRLWFLEQLEPGQATYNVPMALRLRGRLDRALLEHSFATLAERHESLRTVFHEEDGRPVQVIDRGFGGLAGPRLPFRAIQLDALAPALCEEDVRLIAREEARRPFDLVAGPLWRVTLLVLGDEEHVLLVTLHHIVSDGWSSGVLLRDMVAIYGALGQGQVPALPALPVQYADYALWQRAWLTDEVLAAEVDHWRRQLAGAPEVLELLADDPRTQARPPVRSFRGAMVPIEIPAALATALQALCQTERVTPFMALLAVFQVLLLRASGQSQGDICVGAPIAGRTRPEIEGLIGFFVNTLVLRCRPSRAQWFRELLAEVRETTLAAYAHQDLPFEKLVEALKPSRALGHTPLFQVAFALLNAPLPRLVLGELQIEPLEIDNGTAKFDLTLSLEPTAEGWRGRIEYSTDLFEAATIERMARHFLCLLEGVLRAPETRLGDLPLGSQDEPGLEPAGGEDIEEFIV